jgi:predicted dehydrogenase/aryl-alcohol dehydrogenase-like predicted oxidoreductase
MSNQLRWGIIGTGAIAGTLASAIGRSSTGKLVAVASREKSKGAEFGAKFGVAADHAFGDYAELLAAADVDAIYIAIPHPSHAEWAIRAAEAGKHILVEKPVGLNQYQAQAIFEAATAAGVFAMEAFMYRCHPQTAKLVELVASKAIGDLRVIQATFSFAAGFNATSRLYDPVLGGGAILDIGCYPASIARLLAGAATGPPFADAIEVKAVSHLEATGVDGYTIAVAKFPGDIVAQLSAGVAVNQENQVRLYGSKGRIVVKNPWVADRTGGDAGHLTVYRDGEKAPEEIPIPASVTSFTMEIDVFGDAVAAGLKQPPAPAMTWADSIGNMRLLDAWRSEIGVDYPGETVKSFPATTAANRPLKVRSAKMKYGTVDGLAKKVSRLVMGVDNQTTVPHAAAMFDAWFECGGNAFDTAYIYAGGLNEKMLGHWVKARGVRDEVVITCKGAHTPDNFPAMIGPQLTQSLDRLQTDHADLYMMHRDNPAVPAGEFVDVLNREMKAGRIKAFGGSNWSVARVQEANDYAAAKGLAGFAMMSNNFSLARMVAPIWAGSVSASDPISRMWLAKNQIALFCWSSQARGFFTDRAHRDLSLNDEEMNRCWVAEDNWQRRDRVLELAKKMHVLPINIALAYVLAQPFPTFPLIGPRTLEELRTSLPGLSIELSDAEVRWLNLEG